MDRGGIYEVIDVEPGFYFNYEKKNSPPPILILQNATLGKNFEKSLKSNINCNELKS
jgi:hypothetical protein